MMRCAVCRTRRCCDHNPLAALHRAQREGACDDDLAELYWHLPGRPSEACPF